MVTRKRRGLPSAKAAATAPAPPLEPVAPVSTTQNTPPDPSSAMARRNAPASSRRRKKPFVL